MAVVLGVLAEFGGLVRADKARNSLSEVKWTPKLPFSMDPLPATGTDASWRVMEEFWVLESASAACFNAISAMVDNGTLRDLATRRHGPAWFRHRGSLRIWEVRHSDPRGFYSLDDALSFCLLKYYSVLVCSIVTERQRHVV